MKKLIIKHFEDEEVVEIYIDEECIKTLNYDQHGSLGMSTGVNIAKGIAESLSLEVQEEYL